MAQIIRTLSQSDVVALRRLLREQSRTPKAAAGRSGRLPEPSLQAPEDYIALTPPGGLPGISGATVGVADCTIYRELLGVLTPTDFFHTVKNYGGAIPGNAYVQVTRDKFGTWWAAPGAAIPLPPETGTGTSPAAGITICKAVKDECTGLIEYWRFVDGLLVSVTGIPCANCGKWYCLKPVPSTGTGTVSPIDCHPLCLQFPYSAAGTGTGTGVCGLEDCNSLAGDYSLFPTLPSEPACDDCNFVSAVYSGPQCIGTHLYWTFAREDDGLWWARLNDLPTGEMLASYYALAYDCIQGTLTLDLSYDESSGKCVWPATIDILLGECAGGTGTGTGTPFTGTSPVPPGKWYCLKPFPPPTGTGTGTGSKIGGGWYCIGDDYNTGTGSLYGAGWYCIGDRSMAKWCQYFASQHDLDVYLLENPTFLSHGGPYASRAKCLVPCVGIPLPTGTGTGSGSSSIVPLDCGDCTSSQIKIHFNGAVTETGYEFLSDADLILTYDGCCSWTSRETTDPLMLSPIYIIPINNFGSNNAVSRGDLSNGTCPTEVDEIGFYTTGGALYCHTGDSGVGTNVNMAFFPPTVTITAL